MHDQQHFLYRTIELSGLTLFCYSFYTHSEITRSDICWSWSVRNGDSINGKSYRRKSRRRCEYHVMSCQAVIYYLTGRLDCSICMWRNTTSLDFFSNCVLLIFALPTSIFSCILSFLLTHLFSSHTYLLNCFTHSFLYSFLPHSLLAIMHQATNTLAMSTTQAVLSNNKVYYQPYHTHRLILQYNDEFRILSTKKEVRLVWTTHVHLSIAKTGTKRFLSMIFILPYPALSHSTIPSTTPLSVSLNALFPNTFFPDNCSVKRFRDWCDGWRRSSKRRRRRTLELSDARVEARCHQVRHLIFIFIITIILWGCLLLKMMNIVYCDVTAVCTVCSVCCREILIKW